MRTLESYFRDWESNAFGFGYGSGEEHVLPVLKKFFELCNEGPYSHSYDYTKLEKELTPTVAWLLINTLCHHNIDAIEYGSSPRCGWLTTVGERLQDFFAVHNVDQLVEIACSRGEEDYCCSPQYCNCGPDGYDEKAVCQNPFWVEKLSA